MRKQYQKGGSAFIPGLKTGVFPLRPLHPRKIKDFNPKEVKIGMEVEKEHTLDECIREKIVLDHLSEIDDYYTRLIKMETEAKNEKRKRKR